MSAKASAHKSKKEGFSDAALQFVPCVTKGKAMFQPSTSTVESGTSNGVSVGRSITTRRTPARKIKAKTPAQTFDLLVEREYDGSPEVCRDRALIAAIRPHAERGASAGILLRHAQRELEALSLSMLDLASVGNSMSLRAHGNHCFLQADDIERQCAVWLCRGALRLAARRPALTTQDARARIDFVPAYRGALGPVDRRIALRRMKEDLRALLWRDDERLPEPADGPKSLKWTTHIPVPDYCVGLRYQRGDDLLMVEETELKAGGEYVLGKWSSRAAGYAGEPPAWMVGKLVSKTATHWRLRTPTKHVWDLPKKAWGRLYRIVGCRRGPSFVAIE